ncbi:MAG: 50S ribosomal protein L32 [Parcubacteria group bacterium]|nr:50S ribosomal protein L32 [Parcubacteria group bacterium]
MVVHMRHTRSHTGNRRSHHALKRPPLAVCSNCNAKRLQHHACLNCGMYRGRKVIDVAKKLAKKERKQKELANAGR